MSDDLVHQWRRYVAANGPAQTGAECSAQRMADHIEALEAVVEAAQTFLDTSFDIDSLRCPMCRAQHKDGHNRWCWTRPLHDALARLDAQKDKNDD